MKAVAGAPASPSTRGRVVRPSSKATGVEASVLITQAHAAMAAQRWRAATRILEAAQRVAVDADEHRRATEALVVAAASGRRFRLARRSLEALPSRSERPVSSHLAAAHLALAEGRFRQADADARLALSIEPSSHGAWAALAAGFVGLGWFDRATACLDRLDRDELTPTERQNLGQAVNRWALSSTPLIATSVGAAFLVGTLAVAVAVATPLVFRANRLRHLARSSGGDFWVEEANTAFVNDQAGRLLYATVLLSAVAGHVLLTI